MSRPVSTTGSMLEQAMALHRQGDLPAAEKQYRAILTLQPDNPDALHLLGTIRADLGNADEGIALIERALRLFPALPDAHYNLGNIHRRHRRMKAAEHHFRQALKLQPANARTLGNLGGVLTQLERYDDAERYTQDALRLDPKLVEARLNLAALHDIRGRFADTIPLYDAILGEFPKDAETHYMRALTILLRGRLEEGWEEFRWRLERPQTRGFHGLFKFPYWRGESLQDKRILVWTEQGPGDELLIGTMLPDVVSVAKQVVLIASERIAPLFARAFPSVKVIAADNTPLDPTLLTDVGFQASLSELGRWLRPTFQAFPKTEGYLKADHDLAAALRLNYLRDRPGTRLVGLSWQSRNPDLEAEKSMSLANLADILRTPGLTFVNLQYGDCAAEIAGVNRDLGISMIHDPTIDPLRDLTRFAAQTAAMDLIISVSNTTVHMGGALGRPTWAMIPANRGRMWYWFLNREDSPWYGSVRLFRGTTDMGWKPAVERVAAELARWRDLSTPQ